MDRTALRELHRGVTFGFCAKAGYFETPQARAEVDAMAAAGVKWVVLTPTVMQETFASTRQFRDFDQTPSDWELLDIIDYIHAKGMRVHLRPMLECFDGNDRYTIHFPEDRERMPGRVSPYWAQWFAGMEKRAVYYARLAQRAGCELYGLDSELDQTIGRGGYWKRVIRAVREVYDGPVTTDHIVNAETADNIRRYTDMMRDPNHWFHDLDMLSFSFYPRVADKPDTSTEQMKEWLIPLRDKFREMAAVYGKPLFFGECGCTSASGSAICPFGWGNDAAYSGEEQANFLEAVLDVFWEEPWWYGLYWWKWDEQVKREHFTSDPAGDRGFILKGKPAEQVLRRWYGRTDVKR